MTAPSLRRFLALELAISVVINTAMSGLATWALSPVAALAQGRAADIGFEMFMSTMGPVVVFVPALTRATRLRAGRPATPWRLRLPRPLAARAASIGVPALVLLGLPGALLLAAYAHAAPLTFARLMAFKLAYGAVFGLLVTPFVLLAALTDEDRK